MLNGREIKRRRLALKMTQRDAAKRARMTQPQVWWRLEKGLRKSVSLETAVRVAKVLGCKVDDLLRR